MTCSEIIDALCDYLGEELELERRDTFELHLKTCDNGTYKVHTRIVRKLVAQQFNFRSRLLLLPAGQIDKDHLHPRFEQFGIERERFLERVFRFVVVARLAQTF